MNRTEVGLALLLRGVTPPPRSGAPLTGAPGAGGSAPGALGGVQ